MPFCCCVFEYVLYSNYINEINRRTITLGLTIGRSGELCVRAYIVDVEGVELLEVGEADLAVVLQRSIHVPHFSIDVGKHRALDKHLRQVCTHQITFYHK